MEMFTSPVVKVGPTQTHSHWRSNLQSFDFTLAPEHLAAIDATCLNPESGNLLFVVVVVVAVSAAFICFCLSCCQLSSW